MLWTVREVTSPNGEETFELEQDDPPKIGELLTFITTLYEVVGVNLENRLIEVERIGESDQIR
jgi:hypothetical protein